MLESITIFNKGGLILYQYRARPSVLGAGEGAANSAAFTEARVNAWMKKALLGRKQGSQQSSMLAASSSTQIQQKHRHAAMEAVQQPAQSVAVLSESVQQKDKIAVALYPDIFFDSPRVYLKGWIHTLLQRSLDEYELYENVIQEKESSLSSLPRRPDPKAFDKVFLALLDLSKREKKKSDLSAGIGSGASDQGNAGTDSISDSNANNNSIIISSKQNGKKGKEKRHWHDGKAKVTNGAMAALDFSKEDSNTKTTNLSMDPSDQAIAEARAAYLPNYGGGDDDDNNMDMDPDLAEDEENSWGTSFQSVFHQMTGNKVLTPQDLKNPMEEIQKRLTSKNVAQEVAQEICDAVQQQLVGKRLNSFYRVKTAVRQALEASVTKILNRGRSGKESNLDIIRAAMMKKNSGGSFLLGGNKQNTKPYVVVNVGINGVGKSTSLAKLAYYFQSHKLKPMLVAGDTFRSGAVEQLNVHAKCLDVPMFQQGYAKDPSAVTKAAIAHVLSMENVNQRPDVVLVDTAGRMQNSAPLMAALGKLVKENQPDLILLVAEALVGNDGVDQLKMFNRAMQSANRQVDAVILTKFDTVSDKVGAALTMTHITGAPILFVGTGQKYHHLKPLHPSTVIRSLFA